MTDTAQDADSAATGVGGHNVPAASGVHPDVSLSGHDGTTPSESQARASGDGTPSTPVRPVIDANGDAVPRATGMDESIGAFAPHTPANVVEPSTPSARAPPPPPLSGAAVPGSPTARLPSARSPTSPPVPRRSHARNSSAASARSAGSVGAGGGVGAGHARNISTASAMSSLSAATAGTAGTGTSSVGFEEVGFDDGPGWTEAPEMSLPHAARLGAGPPGYAGHSPATSISTVQPATSPRHNISPVSARSEATAAGFGTPSKLSGNAASLASSVPRTPVRDADVPLVLGVAVVDFNHLIGPTVEFAHPASLADALNADEELSRLLPFLALPDGAHLSEEDYSYFHCTYNPASGQEVVTDVPTGRTLFGISCNRQIAASDLLQKSSDVTRSMVQKAVVVLASQPVFGPVRDRLGVVTRAFFAQRDFGSTQILHDFYESLEAGLEGKAGENAIYMGTSLRELVHKFRHRTLVLLKLLLLQKRIMLFGYPVEMLCTYQYSLVSLVPGLLMSLRDCGSPALDAQKQRTRPTSLRTSDRASLLRYMGLPLHLFGADAMFQPYLPLQQMDMLEARSWLVGTTNQIVTQQKDCKYDVLVNIESMTFEFEDPKVERLVTLTPADRKWMDEIVKTVEDSWNLPEGERPGFVGSDDDLRSRFEEYLCAFLASIKYSDFLSQKTPADPGATTGMTGDLNPLANFGESFTSAFRATPAFQMWNSTTDEVIFDLSEPRHPMDGKVSAFGDVGIRLAEGLHDLRIDESLAPTREALSTAFAAGSSTLFRAFDGVRSEVNNRIEAERKRRAAAAAAGETLSPTGSAAADPSGRPVSIGSSRSGYSFASGGAGTSPATGNTTPPGGTGAATPPAASPIDVRSTLGSVGSSISGFFGQRIASFQRPAASPTPERRNSGLRPMSLAGSASAATPRPSPQNKPA